MTKHTPTPWNVFENTIYGPGTPKGRNTWLAQCRNLDERAPDNAAFIVRAVNCHEELVSIIDLLLDHVKADDLPKGSIGRIRQAIAKAEAE